MVRIYHQDCYYTPRSQLCACGYETSRDGVSLEVWASPTHQPMRPEHGWYSPLSCHGMCAAGKGHHVPVHIDDKSRGTEGAMHKNTGTALNLTLFPSARPAWSTRKVSTGLLGLLRLDSHQTYFSPTAIQYQQSLSSSTIYFKSIPRTKFQLTNNDVQRQPLHLAQLSRRSGLPPKYKSPAHRAPLCCDVLLWNADRNGMGPRKSQSTYTGDFIHYPALRQSPLSPSPNNLPLAGPIVAYLPRLRMREAEMSSTEGRWPC